MPNATMTQTDRREAIVKLLEHGPAATQQRLVDALEQQGFVATQSSVSRDLKEIGAIKTGEGYVLPNGREPAASDRELAEVSGLMRELTPAGPYLLVIRTAIGAAQRVALALDRSRWPEIVGTVAGDDTVFAATVNARKQRRVISRIGFRPERDAQRQGGRQ